MTDDSVRLYAALEDRVVTADRSGTDDPTTDRSGTDDPTTDRSGTDDPTTDRSGSDRLSGEWTVTERLVGETIESLAAGDACPDRAFVGTVDGVRRTTDSGDSWEPVGPSVDDRVTALAVSPHDPDVVWAGTEPSAVYRSTDGGESWEGLAPVTGLPSEPAWSFPPRPHTHHVRWIEPDPTDPDRLYVSIEAGALLRTTDGGETWEDRPGEPEPEPDDESSADGSGPDDGPWGDPTQTNGARRDNHSLATHPDRPGRVYAAAGDGYAQSEDGGDTWRYPQGGLDYRYVWGIAVPERDPDTVVVSAATGATMAHGRDGAESYVYRTTDADAVADPGADALHWERAMDGLPDGHGTIRTVLAAGTGHVLYAANNHGLFRSADAGASWERIPVEWPVGDTPMPGGLAVVDDR